VIQVYGPASNNEEEVNEDFYEELEKVVKRVAKGDILLMLGDFNAKVGAREPNFVTEVVGPYGLGEINDAGEKLEDFCAEHELIIMNTWFNHHPRRRYTWTSPDGHTKNQIDFIMIKNRWKTSVLNCKTYPGADCDSDHQLLVATVKIRLHGKKHQFVVTPLNLEELRNEKATIYEIEVFNRFDALGAVQEEKTSDEM